MNGDIILIALVAAAAVLTLLIARLASFLRSFLKTTRAICQKIDHADSNRAYRYWRRELHCHYLCLIPFVNKGNVMSVYRFFFRGGLFAQKQERSGSVVPLLMPSILGMGLCLVCVCSMTWAWYTASLQSSPQKITAAYYQVAVESVKNGESPVASTDGGYPLKAGITYTVTLKASGNATEFGGYCLIQGGNAALYTENIMPGHSMTISFKPETADTYNFTGVWGKCPAVSADQIIKPAGTPINPPANVTSTPENPVPVPESPVPESPVPESPVPESPTPEIPGSVPETSVPETTVPEDQTPITGSYTIKQGDTLYSIASRAGVSVGRLAAYNGITDPDVISPGKVIEIPPKNWVIPAEPAPAEQPAEQPAEPAPAEQPAEPAPAEQPAEPAPAEQPAEPAPVEQPTESTPAEQPMETVPAEQPTESTPETEPAVSANEE